MIKNSCAFVVSPKRNRQHFSFFSFSFFSLTFLSPILRVITYQENTVISQVIYNFEDPTFYSTQRNAHKLFKQKGCYVIFAIMIPVTYDSEERKWLLFDYPPLWISSVTQSIEGNRCDPTFQLSLTPKSKIIQNIFSIEN